MLCGVAYIPPEYLKLGVNNPQDTILGRNDAVSLFLSCQICLLQNILRVYKIINNYKANTPFTPF